MYRFDRKKFKVLLAENEMNQRDLAKKLGIGNASFSKRLNGKYQFRMDEIIAMSETLKCDPGYFFTLDIAKIENSIAKS